ncbi:hypothetical protein [Streptomyces formicae]|uniref:Secreted protein n=1 Tax=Streptomyces formicae TaxID=1616117 RepID=A0ABY3WWB2_9ACTN|nr:hypothetical protein [Streptomyces formicae]UNM15470.1 hypothetical protein J4032_31970 [Streptomyces formicae]UNM16930.1 hypothetical protein J4032_36725 [Streptomyces formicae]UNM16951.1 hypothetical protein J4032_36650 [Streptomyces formicae]
MQPYIIAMIAVVGTLLGSFIGYLLQRRQARQQRSWQASDLVRQETLALIQSTSATYDQREALLWQERRSLYIRYLVQIDEWIEVIRDIRDSGGLPRVTGIRTSEDARQSSPLGAAALDAAQGFARVNVEMTVIAGTPVLEVLNDCRTKLYAAARAAMEGNDLLGDVADSRGLLVRAMRFELTTSFTGDRHKQHSSTRSA